MVCHECHDMLHEQKGYHWYGTYDLRFDHHDSQEELEKSANATCAICQSLSGEVKKALEKEKKRRDSSVEEGEIAFPLRAGLSSVRWWDGVYRLDFTPNQLGHGLGTFLLERVENDEPDCHVPTTDTTGSNEVLNTAKAWIERCKCYTRDDECTRFFPPRLLDLRDLITLDEREASGEEGMSKDDGERVTNSEKRVYLVEKNDMEGKPTIDRRYVTLSYCWGAPVGTDQPQPLRLREDNINELRNGFLVSELPLTLQHAIDFASRIGNGVQYIWIDALCIIQSKTDLTDWLDQSAIMHQIYGNSFLNISATAADNSHKGMYYERRPERLWEDKVEVRLDGIPGRSQEYNNVQLCRVIDATFWNKQVLGAPVNKRGWVLQEQLMAPRVLHFCESQVAWECSCFEATENRPAGFPSFQLKSGDINPGSSLKGLLPERDGKRLREARMGSIDPDEHLIPGIYAYEIWKHVVELYSTTALSFSKDKLIALSGIAKKMSEHIDSRYIAGMWEGFLASQLLWRVEPLFENNRFYYLSSRPKEYRAPSFSWASVDLALGQRIAYGETTDKNIKLQVKKVELSHTPKDNPFGLVDGGYMHLQGNLRRIYLEQLPENTGNLYGWRLATARPNDKFHTNVYLDSPQADADSSGNYSNVFCMPVARGDRKDPESSQYLFCLLLQSVEGEDGTFRRIGLAKLSAHTDKSDQNKVLERPNRPEEVPHLSKESETEYTICVI